MHDSGPFPLSPSELTLWQHVVQQFRLDPESIHGPSHWMTVRRNGLYLAQLHGADPDVIRLFSVFHDSCRESEYSDPGHGPRGALLAKEFRLAGHFQLDDTRMSLLVTACEIHNGAGPQSDPTLATCLDADRLDLDRVGIIPNPSLLSTPTAKDIGTRSAWHELESALDFSTVAH